MQLVTKMYMFTEKRDFFMTGTSLYSPTLYNYRRLGPTTLNTKFLPRLF